MRLFPSDDSRAIFDSLGSIEAEKSGRDFVYTVEREDGSSVRGRVSNDGKNVLTLVTPEITPRSEDIRWDEIRAITIEVD